MAESKTYSVAFTVTPIHPIKTTTKSVQRDVMTALSILQNIDDHDRQEYLVESVEVKEIASPS